MTNLNELTIKIERWARDKRLDKALARDQMLKLVEEVGELAEGLAKGDEWKTSDSIGDIYVVLTILAMQLDLEIRGCVEAAYDEIKDRRGEMVNGVFVKEDDLK